MSKGIEATEAELKDNLAKVLAQIQKKSADGAVAVLKKQLKSAKGNGSNQYVQKGKDEERAKRAKESHKPVDKLTRKLSAESEHEVAKIIGGKRTEDFEHNHTVDVMTQSGNRLIGIEMKTLTTGDNAKMTVHPRSKDRKEEWASGRGRDESVPLSGSKRELHSVFVDKSDMHPKGGQYSGNRMYYRSGVGSYRMHTMTPVKNAAHLRKLLGL